MIGGVFALTVTVLASILVLRRSPRPLYTSVGAVLFAGMLAYHIVSDLLMRALGLEPGGQQFLSIESQRYLLVPMLAVAIFVYASVYALSQRGRAEPTREISQTVLARRVLSWRIWAIPLVPVVLWTWQGRGYKSFQATGLGEESYLSSGLAASLLLVILPLCVGSAIAEFGVRWALPLLLGQSLVLSIGGQRLEVLVVAVLALFVSGLLGVRVPGKALAATALGLLIAVIALTATRDIAGRTVFKTEGNVFDRLSAVSSGFQSLSAPDTSLLGEAASRLDGNVLVAGVTYGRRGFPTLTYTIDPLIDGARTAIPSFIWTDKTEQDLSELSEQVYIANYYGLPVQDYLVTRLGSAVAYGGFAGLLLFAALFGMAVGALDRWIHSRATPIRIVAGLVIMTSALFYERGMATLFAEWRVLLILLPSVGFLQLLNTRREEARAFLRQGQAPEGGVRARLDGSSQSGV